MKSSEVGVKHLDTQKRSLSIRYLLVTWLLVVSAVAFVDRANIAIAGVEISKDFRMNNTQLGWVFSAFLVGYAAFQIPGGIFVRRFGARQILTLSIMWSGTFVILTALLPSTMSWALIGLVGMRFLMGAGEALDVPGNEPFCRALVPDERTWQGERNHFWRRRPWIRPCAPRSHRNHTSLWMAHIVLVQRNSASLGGHRLVSVFTEYSRGAPAVGSKELELIAAGRDDKRPRAATASTQAGQPAKRMQAIPWHVSSPAK